MLRDVSSVSSYHFGSSSLVLEDRFSKTPRRDKCRSTWLERCDITGLASKRLVKQALNDCWVPGGDRQRGGERKR